MSNMSKHKVLLLGATGETGSEILHGLVEDGNFEVSLLVQPSSAQKPAITAIQDRGFKIVIANISDSVDILAKAITGYDTLISAISPAQQLAQLPLVDAAAKAGIKRFVPCGFTTVCPPNGVMGLRDEKEVVYQRIWYQHLPYTIVDVGFWHQVQWFRVPSGKFDYALFLQNNEVTGDGEVKILMTDKRDIGRFVARIVRDPRTLNQKVFTWSDELSQSEMVKVTEEKTGEKVEINHVSKQQVEDRLAEAKTKLAADSGDLLAYVMKSRAEYDMSNYIRGDNTRAVGKYLGYLDARELYPDLEPLSFASYVDELIAGKAKRPYEDKWVKVMKKHEQQTG